MTDRLIADTDRFNTDVLVWFIRPDIEAVITTLQLDFDITVSGANEKTLIFITARYVERLVDIKVFSVPSSVTVVQ